MEIRERISRAFLVLGTTFQVSHQLYHYGKVWWEVKERLSTAVLDEGSQAHTGKTVSIAAIVDEERTRRYQHGRSRVNGVVHGSRQQCVLKVSQSSDEHFC